MGKVKKIIIGLLVTALVVGSVTGALMYVQRSNQTEIAVVSVESLAESYYMPSTTLEGTVTTSVSQNVTIDKDMVIEEVYVNKGDEVAVGDKLVTFDMTLVEMELNIEKLKQQKNQQDLDKAVNRLNSLNNGGPIEETDDTSEDTLSTTTGSSSEDDLESGDDSGDDGDDDMTPVSRNDGGVSLDGETAGGYLAAAVHPVLAAAFTDSADGTAAENETSEADAAAAAEESEGTEAALGSGDSSEDTSQSSRIDMEPTFQDPSVSDFTSGETNTSGNFNSGTDDTPVPTLTPTPALSDGTDYYDPYTKEAIPGISDGEPVFYSELNYQSEPFAGTGTEEDPYIFLCSAAKGKIVAKGSFFNKMAGYNEDGTKIEHEGGFWYQLEFHENDTITNFLDRTESCIGYYLIDGSLLAKPVYMYSEMEFSLDGASTYEEIPEEDPGDDGGYDDDTGTSTMTRAEAIKLQESRIATLKLDIQEGDIEIAKLEKKVNRREIYSKLDGTVSYVGDSTSVSSDGTAFIRVKSKEGFYVKGTVSELMLDQLTEGTKLNCTSYESGSFEAEVMDVADYPVSSSSYFGEGNPNVSYYTYSASITDKSLQLTDQDWLTVTLQNEDTTSDALVLPKAFVLTENGASYVYKDDNGVLKKQKLTVGATVNSGYSVLINGGLSREDKIAFPYGKDAKDGTKTKEGTVDEIYGY